MYGGNFIPFLEYILWFQILLVYFENVFDFLPFLIDSFYGYRACRFTAKSVSVAFFPSYFVLFLNDLLPLLPWFQTGNFELGFPTGNVFLVSSFS